MIVYATHKGGKYLPFEESLKIDAESPRGLYINLTNRCNCDCVFCLRSKKEMPPSNSLWLDREPTVEEVEREIEKVPKRIVKEIVFCGFGEPTLRLTELLELLRYCKEKYPEIPTRLNTNGLGEQANEKIFAEKFAGILDTVSISLNADNAEKYLKLTRAEYGLKSYNAMLDFAEHAKKYVPNVILTVVDKVMSPEEIENCRKICEKRNLTLRVRPYE